MTFKQQETDRRAEGVHDDLIDDLRSCASSVISDYYIDGDFDKLVRNHCASQAADLIATLSAQLAEARALNKLAMAALQPFAYAVYNDNGDMTVGDVSKREHYIKAYFVHRTFSQRDADAAALQTSEKP